MLLLSACYLGLFFVVHANVLDPSLYLSPGPPLLPSSSDLTPSERWTQKLETRVERDTDLLVVPLAEEQKTIETTEPQETMENAETFWRGYGTRSQAAPAFPLTFSLTGTYGRYAPNIGTGIVANKYVFGVMPGGVNEKTLAGSGYGTYPGVYGTRLYGGNSGSSWSGWGNGKWGHYGKG